MNAASPSETAHEATLCPRCGALALEQTNPLRFYMCYSFYNVHGEFEVGVGCHEPSSKSVSELYEIEVSYWSVFPVGKIRKEIKSWEGHFNRFSQAYAVGGAAKPPPGVLPACDKLIALKEALKIAEQREEGAGQKKRELAA